MNILRSICCRSSRVLLISALMSTTLVKSTVGEALVLHQHGASRAHLHVLGYGDVLSNAACSSKFGHSSRPDPAFQSVSKRVRIYTIVTTGSVFVSMSRSTSKDAAGLNSIHNFPPVSIAQVQETTTVNVPSYICSIQVGRSTAADVLLLNHALLI